LKHFRQYLKPGRLAEAIDLRKDVGPKALYIAGGTTVVPFASKGVDVLIDITGLGLDGISDHGDVISIGGTTRLAGLLHPGLAAEVPVVYRAASVVGSPQLRNMATLGGTLAGVFLPSDIGIALLAMGASIYLNGDEERIISIDDLLNQGWLSGYDLITEVRIEKRRKHKGAGFSKFGRSKVDISLVNAAAAIEMSGGVTGSVRIAVGQTGSKPALLNGQAMGAGGRDMTRDLVGELAEKAAGLVKPKADARASADYRKSLIGTMVGRALMEAAREAGVEFAD